MERGGAVGEILLPLQALNPFLRKEEREKKALNNSEIERDLPFDSG